MDNPPNTPPENTPPAPQPGIDPRRRLRELLSIPEGQRTDAQWDEIIELEIQTAPGNRAISPQQRQDHGPHESRGQQQPGGWKRPGGGKPGGGKPRKPPRKPGGGGGGQPPGNKT